MSASVSQATLPQDLSDVGLLGARQPVVVFANGYGDHLMALPAVRALANLYPRRLRLVCLPWADDYFFRELPLAEVVHLSNLQYVVKGDGRTIIGQDFDARALIKQLSGCDLLFGLPPWHSPSMQQLLDGLAPARSVGLTPFYQTVLEPVPDLHTVDRMFQFPRLINQSLSVNAFAEPPPIAAEHAALAKALVDQIPEGMRLLAVQVDTGEKKMWTPTQFTNVIRQFLARHSEFVVFLVGAQNILWELGRVDERVIPCYGLDLPVSMALVGHADLFLGVDSCLLHAADLFRVPGVGLFGPTESAKFGFRFAPHRHICGDYTLTGITEAVVLEAMESLLLEVGDVRRGPAPSPKNTTR